MQKDSAAILEEEYDRFIEFGNLLDRKTRKYLVAYFKHKLEGYDYDNPKINDQYFEYFITALDDIFEIEDLLLLCEKNELITKQVVLDTLYWIRKTFKKLATKHPYDTEVDRLSGWSVTPLKIFRIRRAHLIAFIRETYPREQLDIDFYDAQFNTYFKKEEGTHTPVEKEKFELVVTDLLSQWDALLQGKILIYQLKKLQEEGAQFTELIEAKVNEYKQLLSMVEPFTDYLGWDLSRELWQDTSFDILKKYNEFLKEESSIQELADILGNMRAAEIEIEEETFEKTIIRQEWKVDETAKAEIVGIHESQDLSNLVSSEVGLLSDTATEDLFLKKYADKNLLTFRYEDRKLVTSNDQEMEIFQKVRQKEKGPFIICVDTSESMKGRPEQLAKAICLGILKMAIRENRRAYLINFSVGIQTLDLYDIANSIDSIAKFLQMSFYGGTDASLALYEALRQLKNENYEDADVLMISDFVMYKIDEDVLADIRFHQQNKNTEFHSLTLSDEPNSEILARFDTNWIYDPKEKGIVRELTRGLATIGLDR